MAGRDKQERAGESTECDAEAKQEEEVLDEQRARDLVVCMHALCSSAPTAEDPSSAGACAHSHQAHVWALMHACSRRRRDHETAPVLQNVSESPGACGGPFSSVQLLLLSPPTNGLQVRAVLRIHAHACGPPRCCDAPVHA
jgi:hypothetical protein